MTDNASHTEYLTVPDAIDRKLVINQHEANTV